MKNTNQKLNAYVSLKKVSKNGKEYQNIIVSIPTDNGAIDFQVKLAFNNPKLLYKIRKQLDKEVA